MEIDAQHLIDTLREQRNEAWDRIAMMEAANRQGQSEGDTSSGNT